MKALPTTGAILALALVGGGCAGGDDQSRPSSASDDKSGQSSGDVTALGGGPDSTAPQETTPAQEPTSGDVIAARDGLIDGDAVRLEVTELRRSGATTALTFELSTAEPRAGETEASAQIAQTFDDGLGEPTGGKGQDSFTTDGVSLIDATNRKRYLVARDSEGTCVCDGSLASSFVEPAGPISLSATFGAPPADVDAVDVVIPKFGTFKNVPLS